MNDNKIIRIFFAGLFFVMSWMIALSIALSQIFSLSIIQYSNNVDFIADDNALSSNEVDHSEFWGVPTVYETQTVLLSEEARHFDNIENLSPTPGYVVISSLWSPDKTKLVFYERKIDTFEYNIVLVDESNLKRNYLYKLQYGANEFGACPFEFFPTAWSSGGDLIVVSQVIAPLESDCSLPYDYYFVRDNDLVGIATDDALFNTDFSGVVYVGENETGPVYCGPASRANSGAIYYRDLKSLDEKKIYETESAEMSLIAWNDDMITVEAQTVNKIHYDYMDRSCIEWIEDEPINVVEIPFSVY